MAFEIKHKGPSRRVFGYFVRRQSDGRYWGAIGGWQDAFTLNALVEQHRGLYVAWFTATAQGETYEVAITGAQSMLLLQAYVCDARGKPVAPKPKGKSMNAVIIKGVLHIDGAPQETDVYYEAMSSNGFTKYTAIRWKCGICTCNCPAWTMNSRHKGKDLTARSCKHSKQVALMQTSTILPSAILPTPAAPAVGSTERTGRGIELD